MAFGCFWTFMVSKPRGSLWFMVDISRINGAKISSPFKIFMKQILVMIKVSQKISDYPTSVWVEAWNPQILAPGPLWWKWLPCSSSSRPEAVPPKQRKWKKKTWNYGKMWSNSSNITNLYLGNMGSNPWNIEIGDCTRKNMGIERWRVWHHDDLIAIFHEKSLLDLLEKSPRF